MRLSMLFVCASLLTLGCGDHSTPSTQKDAPATDDVVIQRAKLSPDDRALVDAQEWCPISDERLGSMGVPPKLLVKGQAVFVCCSSCEKKAKADPDKTLAKVEELKSKKKGSSKP